MRSCNVLCNIVQTHTHGDMNAQPFEVARGIGEGIRKKNEKTRRERTLGDQVFCIY